MRMPLSTLRELMEYHYSRRNTVYATTGKVLMHVITHDTHHRGQVLVLARQMGYTPPEIDLI